jgi:hypothetical protein
MYRLISLELASLMRITESREFIERANKPYGKRVAFYSARCPRVLRCADSSMKEMKTLD